VHLSGTAGSVFLADEAFRCWDFAEERPEDAEIRATLMQGATAKGLGANDPKAINFTGHQRNFEDVVRAIRGSTGSPGRSPAAASARTSAVQSTCALRSRRPGSASGSGWTRCPA
jgi:UDP-N-acetyl-2-amino-2-deoxyglucuronate dehydrogenase